MANKEFKYGCSGDVLAEYIRWREDCGKSIYIYQSIYDNDKNQYWVREHRNGDYELKSF